MSDMKCQVTTKNLLSTYEVGLRSIEIIAKDFTLKIQFTHKFTTVSLYVNYSHHT